MRQKIGMVKTLQKHEILIITALHHKGDVAQMVERSLSMREVRGSIPRISNFFSFYATACSRLSSR
jgi:hypothetical protein